MSESIAAQVRGITIELLKGNIVKQEVDAIVNAANTSLLGGGGVDGAIHFAAGPKLLEETRKLGGCKVGDAKITRGYNLPAKHVIHTVGPVYNLQYTPDAPELLASAYRRSLEVATENNLKSMAFPAISTGAYRYPLDKASEVALKTVYEFVTDGQTQTTLELIRFVLYSSTAFSAFEKSLRTLAMRVTELELV